jgi:hypothetical protein
VLFFDSNGSDSLEGDIKQRRGEASPNGNNRRSRAISCHRGVAQGGMQGWCQRGMPVLGVGSRPYNLLVSLGLRNHLKRMGFSKVRGFCAGGVFDPAWLHQHSFIASFTIVVSPAAVLDRNTEGRRNSFRDDVIQHQLTRWLQRHETAMPESRGPQIA